MALTDTEIKIVTYIDQKFWESGGLVTDDLIMQDLHVSKSTVAKCWKKEDFRAALLARGVDLTPSSTADLLTPTQALLANVLFNIGDKRSVREKCEALNISTQQYTAWLRQPAFSNYLRKRAEGMFASTDFVAYQSLSDLVAERDIQGIKLFFEMRGIYNPKVQVEVNVQQVVVKLIEIVSMHVKDPDTLIAIADEIEKLSLPSGQGGALGVGAISAPDFSDYSPPVGALAERL